MSRQQSLHLLMFQRKFLIFKSAFILNQISFRNLIIYPQGRGGIPVTVHDYLTLATDEFVNDVIIDFFLKYVHNELASEEQRDKSHIFSTFFYKVYFLKSNFFYNLLKKFFRRT